VGLRDGLNNLATYVKQAFTPVRSPSSVLLGVIRESFTGAWQSNVIAEPTQNLLAFSAVHSCVSLISNDISKLRQKLMRVLETDLTEENTDPRSPLGRVLRKPNRYQTHIQFINQWIVNKLLHGNAYIYLERDARGVVTAQYVLDSRMVIPLVAEDSSVWYQVRKDYLSGFQPDTLIFPASEIIHDRMMCPWHPLVGISPIYAAGSSATQGIKIQGNSAKFFENMSRPSGVLTSPATISMETIKNMKEQFEANFSGGNLGRLMVAGDGLKYEPMTIPAADSQLIEQLKWTGEDVARCFMVPPYKLGLAAPPSHATIGALNQEYYQQTLQIHIESIEALQDEALGLTDAGYEMEMDLDALLRMDPTGRAERLKLAIGAGWMGPNEARITENLPNVAGGDTPYLQQQNYSLSALAKRDAKDDPFAAGTAPPSPAAAAAAPPAAALPPPAEPAPTKQQEIDAKELTNALIARFLTEAEHG